MARCGCLGTGCTCVVTGDGEVTVTGDGSSGNPYVIHAPASGGNLVLDDGDSIVFGTVSGSDIGTDPLQKIGFYGATPIVQQTVTGTPHDNDLLARLELLGLIVDNTVPENLLNTNTATIETDSFPYNSFTNATGSRVTTIFKSGVASLQLNGSGAGAMDAHANRGPVTVKGGKTYSFLASVRANTTARTSYISVNWFDTAGGFVSNSLTAGVADSNAVWTNIVLTAVAPPNAYSAQIGVQFDAVILNEKHFADELGVFAGTVATWVAP